MSKSQTIGEILGDWVDICIGDTMFVEDGQDVTQIVVSRVGVNDNGIAYVSHDCKNMDASKKYSIFRTHKEALSSLAERLKTREQDGECDEADAKTSSGVLSPSEWQEHQYREFGVTP